MENFTVYKNSIYTLLPATASIFLAGIIFNSQNLILHLPRPASLVFGFIMIHIFICILAEALTQKLIKHFKFTHPTIILWLYPAMAMTLITITAYGFLSLSNLILGRGFWSTWLQLTGQDTTTLFFTCFISMLSFIALQFGVSVFRVFSWIIETSRNHLNQAAEALTGTVEIIDRTFEDIKRRSDDLKTQRQTATRINRKALFITFLCCITFGFWVVFFRPELILYYRAEIQLKTFVEAETAYKTFKHLTEKFPNYRFIDSVFYRMAWIQDRRLNNFQLAQNEYESFLSRYGYNNVWSDEAMTGLVRIYLDKTDKPELALKWAGIYLKTNPEGVMAPHMHLYRIRSYRRLKQYKMAEAELQLARHRFANHSIQIINSEDRLVAFAGFSDVLKLEETTKVDQ